MFKISNVFNFLSTIVSLIMVILLFLLNIILKNISLNGALILLYLSMIVNPILNLMRCKKKKINNPIYHIVLIVVAIFISYICFNGIKIGISFYHTNDINYLNNASLYFYYNYLYMFVPLVFILLLSFIFQKEIIESTKDNSTLCLIIMLIISISYVFVDKTIIQTIANICNLVFIILSIVKFSNIKIISEAQKYYLILIVLNLLLLNPIGTVLAINLYLQLDKNGIMI